MLAPWNANRAMERDGQRPRHRPTEGANPPNWNRIQTSAPSCSTSYALTLQRCRSGRLVTGVTAGATRVLDPALLATATRAWFEYLFSPVTTNWGGDPDAWSMVRHHIAPWYDGVAVTWIALVTATAAAAPVLASAS